MSGFGGVFLGLFLSFERFVASYASESEVGHVSELSRVFAFGSDFQRLNHDGIVQSGKDRFAGGSAVEGLHD